MSINLKTGEMNKFFLKKKQGVKVHTRKIHNVKIPLCPKEINFIVKNLPQMKIPGTNALIGKFNQ